MDAAALTVLLQSCHSFARTDMALYHYNTQNQSITRGPRNLKHLASMETLFDAYSTAARYAEPEGDFFICQEIPSHGRLILPGTGIPLSAALSHQKYMHRIFKRHWNGAKHSDRYADSPPLKRLLWHLYYYSPSVAAITVYVFSNLSRGLRHQYS